jgi:hypothetical protein
MTVRQRPSCDEDHNLLGSARRLSLRRPRCQQALAYAYFEKEPGWRSAAHLPHARRGPADCRQHRQAAGAAEALGSALYFLASWRGG